MISLSADTQTILMLTAPLLNGAENEVVTPLRRNEYRQLQNHLLKIDRRPADLIGDEADLLIKELETTIEAERLRRLLNRGFELTQALEGWQNRSIWVLSHSDDDYPNRFRDRLKSNEPLIVYGCGDITLTQTNCFGVVGSRDVSESLVEYTESVGSLAARSGYTVVSGGARGVDQAAMRGAIEAAGKVVGILADSLEHASVSRDNRDLMVDGRLLFLSVQDPSIGFGIGNAMQRNKLIYALSDASLVVNSDYEKGGTWAGAIEQLEKYHSGPIYVRDDRTSEGLSGLKLKGALPWPDPVDANEFVELMSRKQTSRENKQLSFLDSVLTD